MVEETDIAPPAEASILGRLPMRNEEGDSRPRPDPNPRHRRGRNRTVRKPASNDGATKRHMF
jgi:hypothetical protein